MSEKIDFDGQKVCCPQCGSPAIRKTTLGGTTYFVSVIESVLDSYFDTKDGIDDFIRDRLLRAERIISSLRREIEQMRDRP